ncbi:MAG: glycosyltransferase [Mucilaginibacter sp.]|jgi:glycosyltransferase involved in cell wall biosynthesis|uniref:glycosyltransferase n=1 Tax=Mucilaginibacter sp. TaxID=1882438 RepID=UPI0035635F9A
MGKKVVFILGSLGAGGSERVFWLLAQHFNNRGYNVSIVVLNGGEKCYSTDIPGITFIDLQTIRASKSFIKLYRLLKSIKPDVVFSTVDHINLLLGILTWFIKLPVAIARASNSPTKMKEYYKGKERLFNSFTRLLLSRMKYIVCQTKEMETELKLVYKLNLIKLKVIANPVLMNNIVAKHTHTNNKRLIAVGRLSPEKGIDKLLQIMSALPSNYYLDILGDGPLMVSLLADTKRLKLTDRVRFLGKVIDVTSHLVKSDLLLLTSITEGFPNVVLEALSTGVPVVCYSVGGASELIINGVNGYIVEQDDAQQFKEKVLLACAQVWPHQQIKSDTYKKFELSQIGRQYELLIN